MLRELGQQLAALRRGAGLTQENLAALTTFSRSTVSVAEIGHQPQSRRFWAACDKALDSGGVLAAGFDQINAVREAEERAAARAAQQAREARALAAFTAAQHRDGVAAGVTAVQSSPQCGCQVAVLTTLISQPSGPATTWTTNDAVASEANGDSTASPQGRGGSGPAPHPRTAAAWGSSPDVVSDGTVTSRQAVSQQPPMLDLPSVPALTRRAPLRSRSDDYQTRARGTFVTQAADSVRAGQVRGSLGEGAPDA